ncbi:appr-1-p processing domain-containing protein [Ochrobactrum phage vB_OspM_OC]|nr:appr-1-p processing domain-containing protein [Ochrobactrum phage vB_OspM_OC]
MGEFTIERGNIFNYAKKVDYITVPTNSVGTMGGGLAYQFMRHKNYAANCIEYNALSASLQKKEREFDKFNNLAAGLSDADGFKLIKPLISGTPKEDGVLFFPTKIHFKRPSEMAFIDLGFKILNDDPDLEGKTFAMPLLGAGLGGLNPMEVEERMKYLTSISSFNVVLVKPNGIV